MVGNTLIKIAVGKGSSYTPNFLLGMYHFKYSEDVLHFLVRAGYVVYVVYLQDLNNAI